MAMDVNEAKQAKLELEKDIAKMLKKFEEETGFKMGYIDVQRKRIKKKPKANDVASIYPEDSWDSGAIETVNIEMRV